MLSSVPKAELSSAFFFFLLIDFLILGDFAAVFFLG